MKPDLRDMPKPPRVYPRLNRRLRIAMLLALIGGPIMIAASSYEYYQISKLRTDGRTAPGVLVHSHTVGTGKGRTSYQITLDYKPPHNDVMYRKTFFVTEAVYDQARQTGQIPVKYLPSNARVSTTTDGVRRTWSHSP